MVKRKRLLSAFNCKGFTLVELLMALVVAGIVSAAVVTLAFAVSSANDVTDNTSQTQAYVRYATLRISELIRHCKLVCCMPGGDLVIWRADDNDNGRIYPFGCRDGNGDLYPEVVTPFFPDKTQTSGSDS